MFDSGVGGLTVARSVIDLLPHEDVIYFGDSARCPYGPRPLAEVRRFALEVMDLLMAEDVKLLVVACNAASSAALDEARERYEVPVIGVIEPGVKAAMAATRNGTVGVIGTQATIESRSYEKAVVQIEADVTLVPKACPRFVEFVEKGDTTSDEVLELAHEYLDPLRGRGVDTLVLACTHYPLLSGVIQYVMGEGVVLVSSADATATDVYARLRDDDLLQSPDRPGVHRFVSSSEEGISSDLGMRFLGPEFGELEHRPWPGA